jgi:hypothetical protein
MVCPWVCIVLSLTAGVLPSSLVWGLINQLLVCNIAPYNAEIQRIVIMYIMNDIHVIMARPLARSALR